MKINDLKIFITVLDTGSLTHAAGLLDISQPGLSRHIKDIEKRLNTRLLHRTGRGVHPTPAGVRFYQFAKQTLNSWDETCNDIQRLRNELPSSLSIAIPIRTGRLLIPTLHKALSQELPNLHLRIDEEYSIRSRESLQTGRIDMAISYKPPLPGSIAHESLFEESLFVVGREDIIGKNNKRINLNEVAQLPLLLSSESTPIRKLINASLTNQVLNPVIRHELETSEALLAFAIEGEGAAILPYSNIAPEHQAGEVAVRKIINPQIKRKVCLTVAPHTDLRLAVRSSKVIRHVFSEMANSLGWAPL